MRFYTVWDFRGLRDDEVVRVVRVAESNDMRVQHYFQRVVGQVLATSKAEALASVNSRGV